MKKIFYLFFTASIFTACNNDDDSESNPVVETLPASILIGNEGGFLNENASLTLISIDSNQVRNNVFYEANGATALGDVLHSMYLHKNEVYLVVNNSQKIEVVDPSNFQRKRTITGLDSPRQMLFISDDKAYVSDLFANGIHIVNPSTGTYSGFIDTGLWLENMELVNGEVWATNPGGDKLIFIDPNTDEVFDELSLSVGPSDMEVDADGMVWVFCEGQNWMATPDEPKIHKINPANKEISHTFDFPNAIGYAGSLETSTSGTEIVYLIGNNVYKMAVSATSLPGSKFIEGNSRNLYGLMVDPYTEQIVLTDAKDFSQSGDIFFYSPEGALLRSFQVGVAPKSVLWLE